MPFQVAQGRKRSMLNNRQLQGHRDGLLPGENMKRGDGPIGVGGSQFVSEDKVIGGMIVCFFGGFRISL